MTNAEKYKDGIIAQECKTSSWAVDKVTNKIVDCNAFPCPQCLFYGGCGDAKIRWLNSEYKERKEFTDDERKLIELLDKLEWIARDDDNVAYIFGNKPFKENGRWYSNYSYCVELSLLTSLPFAAIKSTDTEPTSRAEILGEK